MRLYRVDTHEFLISLPKICINTKELATYIYDSLIFNRPKERDFIHHNTMKSIDDIKMFGICELSNIPIIDIDFDFSKLKSTDIVEFHYKSFSIRQIIKERNKILVKIRNNKIDMILK